LPQVPDEVRVGSRVSEVHAAFVTTLAAFRRSSQRPRCDTRPPKSKPRSGSCGGRTQAD